MNLPEFKYVEKITDRYALLHYTGTGVAENPHKNKGYICQSNNSRELELLARKLFLVWNSDEEKISTWISNHFTVKEVVL